MKITREFCPGDRYVYDFGLCNHEKGWAQVDTAQDASYFGKWAKALHTCVRDRHLCQPYCGLESIEISKNGFRFGCALTGALCAQARS